jgi:tRNA dimethylallyltransferase
MFASGLLEEVERILQAGVPDDAKALEALGYRQAVLMRRGELTREEAVALTERDTRRYAKRQWTWFRRDPDIVWLSGFGDDRNLQAAAIEQVRRFLQ